MSYFRGRLPHNYRRRCPVSLLSSERDQVVPGRSNHQKNALNVVEKEGRDPKCVGSQEIDLFALVTLNPYGSSSANRLTRYSAGGLIWNPNLGVGFPLRCFQRLSVGNIATRRFC